MILMLTELRKQGLENKLQDGDVRCWFLDDDNRSNRVQEITEAGINMMNGQLIIKLQ